MISKIKTFFKLTLVVMYFVSYTVLASQQEGETVNISAKLFGDKYFCREGVPILVLAPNDISGSKLNTAILTIQKEELYFQNHIKYASDIDDLGGGFLFCTSDDLLSGVSFRLLYGSSDCIGYKYKYEIDGFSDVLNGSSIKARLVK